MSGCTRKIHIIAFGLTLFLLKSITLELAYGDTLKHLQDLLPKRESVHFLQQTKNPSFMTFLLFYGLVVISFLCVQHIQLGVYVYQYLWNG